MLSVKFKLFLFLYCQATTHLDNASNNQNLTHNFNFSKNTIVFVHIQRTGGTYLDTILTNHISEHACTFHGYFTNQYDPRLKRKRKNNAKKCSCPRTLDENGHGAGLWLQTRTTTRWQLCGLHAPFSQLKACASIYDRYRKVLYPNRAIDRCKYSIVKSQWCDYIARKKIRFEKKIFVGSEKISFKHISKRFHFITILRHPITRFLSEFKLAKRGRFWDKTIYTCQGKIAYMPRCFSNRTYYSNMTIEEFLKCPNAANRMIRHLADIKDIHCPKNHTYNKQMLQSAKRNLQKKITAFAILEKLKESRIFLTKALGIKFLPKSVQRDRPPVNTTVNLAPPILQKIEELNKEDIELYEFAVNLLENRLSGIPLNTL